MKQPKANKFMLIATALFVAIRVLAQDKPSGAPLPPNPPQKVEPAEPSRTAQPVRAEIEKKLEATLRGATLEGSWQMTGEGGLASKNPLTPPRPEKYMIMSATKTLEDNWIITARIQFGEKDVQIPVPVRIVWAEDTPIITLNEMNLPLLGPYSARVIFHEGFYSGVWYSKAKNYGGVMSGRISHEEKVPAATKNESGKPAAAKPSEPKKE